MYRCYQLYTMFQRKYISFSEEREVHLWFVEHFSVGCLLIYLKSRSSSKKNLQSVLAILEMKSWRKVEREQEI